MSSLQYGLAPKMKPVSPRRPALVAALDIGTSKIVCLIARLTPHAPQETLRRRSHGIEILGIGHVEAHGMKAGHVADIQASRRGDPPRRRSRRALRLGAAAIGRGFGLGRTARQRNLQRLRRRRRVEGRPTTTSRACSPPAAAIRRATGGWCMHSLPIGFSLDDARGVREPRGMLARQFGVDMHVVDRRRRDAPQPYARGRAMPSRRRGDGGVALCRGPCGSGRRRIRSRVGRRRYGGGDHDHRGLLGRPLHPCRRLRARRAARDPRPGARPRTPESRMPSESKRSMALCWPVETMNGT